MTGVKWRAADMPSHARCHKPFNWTWENGSRRCFALSPPSTSQHTHTHSHTHTHTHTHAHAHFSSPPVSRYALICHLYCHHLSDHDSFHMVIISYYLPYVPCSGLSSYIHSYVWKENTNVLSNVNEGFCFDMRTNMAAWFHMPFSYTVYYRSLRRKNN